MALHLFSKLLLRHLALSTRTALMGVFGGVLSLMIFGMFLPLAELGHLALVIALVLSLSQAVMPILPFGTLRLQYAQGFQLAAAVLVGFAFGVLVYSFMVSDFSIALVTQHSHSLKPMLYKISGTWGNHEGSLLLWILILVLFGGIFALTSNALPPRFVTVALSVQATITFAFLAFSLFTSNPFERLDSFPLDGHGLNPVLQDIGLALHPPMLYLGYVGLSKAFSLSVAGLITGHINRDWGRWVRPWVLSAWSALTIGIALGSWWAYYELGWGGWWFWDPVENASLMPWLAATALMHSVIVVEKRGQLKSWAILLAILSFSLSLVGTFIVRSGLLTSVHSFASDPSRGIFILLILMLAIGIPLMLYAWRGPWLKSEQDSMLISRDTGIIINNIILVIAAGVVIIGTFYPLALELMVGARITVGPPFFAASFYPIMAFALIGMVIGTQLVWRGGILPQAKTVISIAAICSVIVMVISVMVIAKISPAQIAGMGLLGWLFFGVIAEVQARLKLHQLSTLPARLSTLGLAPWGSWLGHLGMAVFLIGAMGDGLGGQEHVVRAKPGTLIEMDGRNYRFLKIEQRIGANYEALTAVLQLETKSGTPIAIMAPEKRFFPAEGQTTTEVAIHSRPSGDDYAVLGDGNTELGYSLRLYRKPLIGWIWGGAGIMAFGGIMSFIGRQKLKNTGGR
ncbi:MAG: heme lyase CcmF/NrfE family subunit [Candidatus Puniceispirillales bacterium WSBS_2018_MAG_OTU23]